MKQFLVVLQFEISQFLKNKTYVVTTVLLSLLLAGILSLPSIVKLISTDDAGSDEKTTYAIYGDEQLLPKQSLLSAAFEHAEFRLMDSENALKDAVKQEEAEAGFIIQGPSSYQYVVNNTTTSDMTQARFDELMKRQYQLSKLAEMNVDVNAIDQIYQTPITSESVILGKDGVSNFLYTYILIFALYFMIIFYGQLIASNVASEKSNRAIEVLVTSANPNCLIFGKVIAGALEGVFQFGMILLSCTISYQFNREAWNYGLDMVFNIPLNAIISFSAFGILGYLFYSFIFGAIGALASKTEDINTSATPITMIFVLAFMITAYGMGDPDGIVMTIASYVPLSSFMSMFVRVAMGSVSMIEICLSLFILAGSTILIGILAAKVYRMGTLHYGNALKWKDALKMIRHQK